MCATFKLHTHRLRAPRPCAHHAPYRHAPWLHAGGALPPRRGRPGSNRAVLQTNYTNYGDAALGDGYTYYGVLRACVWSSPWPSPGAYGWSSAAAWVALASCIPGTLVVAVVGVVVIRGSSSSSRHPCGVHAVVCVISGISQPICCNLVFK